MRVEMVMPQMGESIVEGTIIRWTKKVGDVVAKDENILEISTDKVDSEIPSPSAGRIVELKANEGDTIPVGGVIAILETDVDAEAEAAPAQPAGPKSKKVPAAKEPAPAQEPPRPEPAPSEHTAQHPPAGAAEPPAREVGDRFYSPLVRSMAREEGISVEDLSRIQGSGRGGRVTKDDVLHYLQSRGGSPSAQAQAQPAPGASPAPVPPAAKSAPLPPAQPAAPGAPAQAAAPAAAPAPSAGSLVGRGYQPYPVYTPSEVRSTPEGRVEVVLMDNIRQKIAEHMVRSKQISPHVASATEVDMTRVVRYREAYKDEFLARHGFKLTFTPFIVTAAVRALLDYPMMNASVNGTEILVKRYVNVGVAVALESGLIVPVVKHADEKNFMGIARSIQDLAQRARSRKLTPDDVSGGTFAVTNMGGFGNLFGIPIINQPNVGILGAGAIVKRPVVVGEAIAIRDIMVLTLSYDHRVVDGALGGRFIQRARHYLEEVDLVGSV